MIASPCVNVCQMSPELDLCAGCLRTLDEIARWTIMRDEERVQVLAAVAARQVLLGPIPGATQPAAPVTAADPAQAHNHPHRR